MTSVYDQFDKTDGVTWPEAFNSVIRLHSINEIFLRFLNSNARWTVVARRWFRNWKPQIPSPLPDCGVSFSFQFTINSTEIRLFVQFLGKLLLNIVTEVTEQKKIHSFLTVNRPWMVICNVSVWYKASFWKFGVLAVPSLTINKTCLKILNQSY